MNWFGAFVLTLAVEVPVYVAALSLVGSVPPRRALLLAIAVNAVSHPLLWFVIIPSLADLGATTALLVGELLVLAGETTALAVFAPQDRRLALPAAVIANGLSFLIGVLVAA